MELIAASIGGVVLGWVLSQLGEHWQAKRQDRTRFAAARREVYARFLVDAAAAIHALRSAAYAAQREPRPQKGNVAWTQVDPIITSPRRVRQSEIEVKLLAGNSAIVAAAADVRHLAGYGVALVADQHDPHAKDGPSARYEADWEAAVAAASNLRGSGQQNTRSSWRESARVPGSS